MNPMALMGLKASFEKFKNNHPKFISFVQAMANKGLPEGTILECKVITVDGKEYQTNLKITKEDLELFQKIKEMNL